MFSRTTNITLKISISTMKNDSTNSQWSLKTKQKHVLFVVPGDLLQSEIQQEFFAHLFF